MSRNIKVTFPNNDSFKQNVAGGPIIMLSANIEQFYWDLQLQQIYNIATTSKFANFNEFKKYLEKKSLYNPPGEPVKTLDINLFDNEVPSISINNGLQIAGDWNLANDPCAKSGKCGYGKINMTNIKDAIKSAGYIKQSDCPPPPSPSPSPPPSPSPSPPPPPPPSSKNIWNGLSIAMTCTTGIFFIIIIITMLSKKSNQAV
jgi:hypothetical protein